MVPYSYSMTPPGSTFHAVPAQGGGMSSGMFSANGPGGTRVDAQGNAPMTDMLGFNSGGGSVHHDNSQLQGPGAAIGYGIGSIWGMGPLGAAAGRNAGSTAGDLFAGNINGLGADVSQNLPPGFQDKGWGGILNGATGLPLSKMFSWF